MGKRKENPTVRILILGATGVGKNCLESRVSHSSGLAKHARSDEAAVHNFNVSTAV